MLKFKKPTYISVSRKEPELPEGLWMKCDGCVQAVTEKFSGIDGVTNVAVHLADQTAVVTADREVSQDELNTTLADTKFKVVSE